MDLVTAFMASDFLARTDPTIYSGFLHTLENKNDEFIRPFLERNRGKSAGTILCEIMRRLGAHEPVAIPEHELTQLQHLLKNEGVPLEEMNASWTDFLTGCALRGDYKLFSEHMQHHLENSQTTWAQAFLTVMQGQARYLPWLEFFLLTHGGPREHEDVLRVLSETREAEKLRAFKTDLLQRRDSHGMQVTIEMVDAMNPYKFELLLGMIYASRGYAVTETPASGDQGADVLVAKGGERTVIQAKLYSKPVPNKAVQEAHTAKGFYKCHHAMVICNHTFTASASVLAESVGVELVDRSGLVELLDEFDRSPKDYDRLVELLAQEDLVAETPPSPPSVAKLDQLARGRHGDSGQAAVRDPARQTVWIETSQGMRDMCDQLRRVDLLGVDVETTLRSRALCLIQIACSARTYLIDALAVTDLSPLGELFGDPAVTKVIHNAAFEREVLGRYGLTLEGVLDTLVASRDRRGPDAHGGHDLSAVCERELGFRLDKAQQTIDWTRRPLTQEQLTYAALDCEVLLELRARLDR